LSVNCHPRKNQHVLKSLTIQRDELHWLNTK